MRPSRQFMLSMVMIGSKRVASNLMPPITPWAMNLAQASASTVARDIRSPVL